MSVLLLNATSANIPLKAGSVHMIATSPPYYGLRNYLLPGTAWPAVEFVPMAGLPAVSVPEWEGCLGMEPDPLMFIAHIVHIMREGRRVLRDDGVAWVNFGDSYANPGHYKGNPGDGKNSHAQAERESGFNHSKAWPGAKNKDLIGIPWRVAFALQADGWYLRSDVIWSKANPMPSSVNGWRWEQHRVKVSSGRQDGAYWQDCPGCAKCIPNGGYVLRQGSWRPTTSHEYVFMLAKSEDYYSDKYAVEEEAECTGGGPFSSKYADEQPEHGGESAYRRPQLARALELAEAAGLTEAHIRAIRSLGTSDAGKAMVTQVGAGKNSKEVIELAEEAKAALGGYFREFLSGDTRNKRSVWNVNPQPYKGAHFATWPPDLVEPMIKSSTSERGVCPTCGAPWVRVVEKGTPQPRPDNPNEVKPYGAESGYTNGTGATTLHMIRATETTDWRPSCSCPEHQPVPAVVLDIFAGSGTTLQVARQLGRHGIGLDLSFSYLKNEAKQRLDLNALEALQTGTGLVQTAGKRRKKTNPAQMGLL